MTDVNLTEIVTIIDRSGSMASLVDETISGFNMLVEEQAKLDAGKALLTLVQFNDSVRTTFDCVDVKEKPLLSKENYVPGGYTSLYDAIGLTIENVGKRLSETAEENRPSKILVFIMTDGAENTSKKFSQKQIKEMIEHQTEKYGWEFSYIGNGTFLNHQQQAQSIGFAAQSIDVKGTLEAYHSVTRAVSVRRTQ